MEDLGHPRTNEARELRHAPERQPAVGIGPSDQAPGLERHARIPLDAQRLLHDDVGPRHRVRRVEAGRLHERGDEEAVPLEQLRAVLRVPSNAPSVSTSMSTSAAASTTATGSHTYRTRPRASAGWRYASSSRSTARELGSGWRYSTTSSAQKASRTPSASWAAERSTARSTPWGERAPCDPDVHEVWAGRRPRRCPSRAGVAGPRPAGGAGRCSRSGAGSAPT